MTTPARRPVTSARCAPTTRPARWCTARELEHPQIAQAAPAPGRCRRARWRCPPGPTWAQASHAPQGTQDYLQDYTEPYYLDQQRYPERGRPPPGFRPAAMANLSAVTANQPGPTTAASTPRRPALRRAAPGTQSSPRTPSSLSVRRAAPVTPSSLSTESRPRVTPSSPSLRRAASELRRAGLQHQPGYQDQQAYGDQAGYGSQQQAYGAGGRESSDTADQRVRRSRANPIRDTATPTVTIPARAPPGGADMTRRATPGSMPIRRISGPGYSGRLLPPKGMAIRDTAVRHRPGPDQSHSSSSSSSHPSSPSSSYQGQQYDSGSYQGEGYVADSYSSRGYDSSAAGYDGSSYDSSSYESGSYDGRGYQATGYQGREQQGYAGESYQGQHCRNQGNPDQGYQGQGARRGGTALPGPEPGAPWPGHGAGIEEYGYPDQGAGQGYEAGGATRSPGTRTRATRATVTSGIRSRVTAGTGTPSYPDQGYSEYGYGGQDHKAAGDAWHPIRIRAIARSAMVARSIVLPRRKQATPAASPGKSAPGQPVSGPGPGNDRESSGRFLVPVQTTDPPTRREQRRRRGR